MQIYISNSAPELGMAAGNRAAECIRAAIAGNGTANIILATGASQFETLKQLVAAPEIQWDKVVMFHLDEYIGLPVTHKASFRKYLQELFIDRIPGLKHAYLIDGEGDPRTECKRLNEIILRHPIDVALVGIGENGHLAFNDPPADFDIADPYLVIPQLDADCRKQQLGEGWFASLAEVPDAAISMSVRQIMKSKEIICSVPDARKAVAVKNCLENQISNLFPASILRTHGNCGIYLDIFSAGLIDAKSVVGS